jgi:FkbM family methyltransferase
MLKRSLVAVARHAPTSLIRAIGRRTGGNRLLGLVDRVARSALNADVTIPRGEGAGLRFNSAGGRAGFGLGTWEPEVQAALARLLQPGNVVFDIGAATGFYSIIAARCVGPGGTVVAFEPAPENLAALRHNVGLNALENVEVIEAAIADDEGQAVMVPEATDEVSLVMKRVEAGPDNGSTVEVTSLDALRAAGRIPVPDVIKMDVEGVEVEVLRGARDILAAHGPVLLIEVHERWTELAPLLKDAGYTYEPLEGIDPAGASRAVHIVATPERVNA